MNGHPLVVKAGTNIELVFKVAADTSEPPASSVAIASLSDRWISGDQEIWLSFTRSTALFRKAGSQKDQREPITGPKVWVWSAFLAFLCGLEWATPTLSTYIWSKSFLSPCYVSILVLQTLVLEQTSACTSEAFFIIQVACLV